MPNSITLISEVGRPLTCAEVDNNWLQSLNRANHTGTQAAATIYDLPTAVMTIPGIQSITSTLTQLNGQITDLQEQVLGQQGYVSTLVNNLRADLTEDITNLTTLVNQHSTQIGALQARDITLQAAIDALRVSVDDNIDDIDGTIQCLRDGTCLLVPVPPDEQGDLVLGYDDETNALVWGLPLSLFCGPLIEGAFPVGGRSNLQLGTIT